MDLIRRILEKKPRFLCLDTEFERRDTYFPLLSLLQVGVFDAAYIIDALQCDLGVFKDIFEDTTITKVFHSAHQDLEALFFHTQLSPAPIFDTQIALGLLGHGLSLSYQGALAHLFNQSIEKEHQCFAWLTRPLPEAVLKYAAEDVLYLERLVYFCKKTMDEDITKPWFEEMMEHTYHQLSFHQPSESVWEGLHRKMIQHHGYGKKRCAYGYSLYQWRETWAREINIPRQHLMHDHHLIRLAGRFPVDKDYFLSLLTLGQESPQWDNRLETSIKAFLDDTSQWEGLSPPPLEEPWRYASDLPYAEVFMTLKETLKSFLKKKGLPLKWFCRDRDLYTYVQSLYETKASHPWHGTWRETLLCCVEKASTDTLSTTNT
jgi:ribonuclease D